MSLLISIQHEFVEYIPETIADGKLYVSIPYATAVHNCCCGCGREVVTPLSPTDWTLLFDGRAVSLDPSIGNWSFPCQSHYWIRGDRVLPARKWTSREIKEGRAKDREAKHEYGLDGTPVTQAFGKEQPQPQRGGIWYTIKRWLS